MIERIYMKDNLGFKEVNLTPKTGLNVFTGLSGAGKSVLFNAILSCFALQNSEAKLVELDVDEKLDLQDLGIEKEEIYTFKLLKDKNTRYFINNQSIAKKALITHSNSFISYLCAKNDKEFSNENFLELLDLLKKEKKFESLKQSYAANYKSYKQIDLKLSLLEDEEKKVEELKEFTRFEIEKIEKINPKEGEYEELIELKKRLSKRDKIEEAWSKVGGIFELESAVSTALSLSDVSPRFFEDTINELRLHMEKATTFDEDYNIENLLDRLEALSFLINKYSDIKTCMKVLEEKKKNLEHYENLSFEKEQLIKEKERLLKLINEEASSISKVRKTRLKELEGLINSYLLKLYMKEVNLELKSTKLGALGADEVSLRLEKAFLNKLSLGELNRLRLAFIAVATAIKKGASGIIFLDEIDANLSGKEAMSIAKVLDELGEFYQIFAISHLPQLSSYAKTHFLVSKSTKGSFVKELNADERVAELARMISGDEVNEEAASFAKTLLKHQF